MKKFLLLIFIISSFFQGGFLFSVSFADSSKNLSDLVDQIDYQGSGAGIFSSTNGNDNPLITKKLKTGDIIASDIPIFLKNIGNTLLGLIPGIVLFMILIGAFQHLLSASEGGKTSGIETIKGALIGLVISLSAGLIIYGIIANF